MAFLIDIGNVSCSLLILFKAERRSTKIMEVDDANSQYGLDVLNRQQNREQYVSIKSNLQTNDGSIDVESFSPSENFRRESIMSKVRRKGTITSGGGVTSVISGKPIIKPDGSVSLL
jgi:hypothetical protein